MTSLVTSSHIKELLNYDPDTGIFIWHTRPVRKYYKNFDISWNRKFANKKAGSKNRFKLDKTDYLRIDIYDRHYAAHRLAWLYMTGKWPNGAIDHRDGNGLNNKWNNLRLANAVQNGGNRKINENNTSGYKGVSFDKSRGLYRAVIKTDGKTKHIGRYVTPEEAHIAYMVAAKRYFGEFARAA